MTTQSEQDKLIQVLKFTPCTYTVQIWGYGGEYVMGTVDRKIYDYFKSRRLSLSDYAWDSDYAEEHNIPEELQPFPPGSWYECDNMAHVHGVDRSAGTLQILDENGNVIFEKSLDDIVGGGCDGEPDWSCNDEVWIDSQDPGTVVFVGVSSEKGTFFEGEIELAQPFDITKLCISYDEIDGNEIVSAISYDSEDIDNNGSGTNGKSSDFGFYIAGSQKDGKWEKYTDMDDIEYTLTNWFPAQTTPYREGKYNVKTLQGHEYHCMWNGTHWKNDWNDEPVEVVQWQGVAYDPDEQDLRDEFNRLVFWS